LENDHKFPGGNASDVDELLFTTIVKEKTNDLYLSDRMMLEKLKREIVFMLDCLITRVGTRKILEAIHRRDPRSIFVKKCTSARKDWKDLQ
jgi:hypothetical protein